MTTEKRRVKSGQYCFECGRSVKAGDGFFANRVPSLDSPAERKTNGVGLFLGGNFICSDCDDATQKEVHECGAYFTSIQEALAARKIWAGKVWTLAFAKKIVGF